MRCCKRIEKCRCGTAVQKVRWLGSEKIYMISFGVKSTISPWISTLSTEKASKVC